MDWFVAWAAVSAANARLHMRTRSADVIICNPLHYLVLYAIHYIHIIVYKCDRDKQILRLVLFYRNLCPHKRMHDHVKKISLKLS